MTNERSRKVITDKNNWEKAKVTRKSVGIEGQGVFSVLGDFR